jgi:L-iditol 2-dehydrogenase
LKSVRLHAPGDLQLHSEPVPMPSMGEVKIHVTAVGVCGSDLHWFNEGGIGDSKLVHPLVLGHEFSGITEDGSRVAADPAIPCGKCEQCLRGDTNLCPSIRFAGHGEEDGAMREYICWPERQLHFLPDSLSDNDGVMLEPLGVALHAVDLAHLRVGMSVGVFGCGPIGLLIVQLARLSGVSIVLASDILRHRAEAARSFGANPVFEPEPDIPEKAILEATGGRGLDVAFEAAGTQGAVNDAFNAVKPGGKVILAGIPAEERTSFNAATARRKGLTIKMVRRMKNTYPRAISLVSSGKVDVRSLVTHTFPLEQASQAFATAGRREGLKVIIKP